MTIALVLGVLAGTLQLLGYVVYNITMAKKGQKPNIASWLIWTTGSIANTWSFIVMSDHSAENILPAVCSICCILTFIHIWIIGKMERIGMGDWLIITIDSCIIIYWAIASFIGDVGQSAMVANLLFQASTILSFVPIIREVYREPGTETRMPWGIWSAAYAVEIIVLWSQMAKWEEWVYPSVCLPLCFILTIIAKPRR